MDIKKDRQCTYTRNTEARFGNHCHDGKAISIIQPGCVFVALGIQHAMRLRHILICGIPHPKTYFNIISYKARYWEKMLLKLKCMFGFPLQRLSETYLILRRTERDDKECILVVILVRV
jgi:hypothetical protein